MLDFWLLGLSIFVFVVWLVQGLDLCFGVLFKIPVLEERSDSLPSPPPKVSIIFAARNESRKISKAVQTMLAQDYPDFEVIAVNDRSTDSTLSLLHSLASNEKLKIVNVEDLPAGWLGKNHALYQGYRISTGEWVLFTDADVRFHPQTLRTAVRAALQRKLDHLVLFPRLIFKKWIEALFAYAFMLAFYRRYRPWQAADPASKCFVGIGAFNLVKRSAYESAGTHRRLALEILDDMKLGELLKYEGVRQMPMFGEKWIQVQWVEGYKGVIRSLEKNAFAGADYNPALLGSAALASLILDIFPFFAVWFAEGAALGFLCAALALIFAIYLVLQARGREALAVFPFHPVGYLLLFGVMGYSAVKTLAQGGVTWRDTFYPLAELREFRIRKAVALRNRKL